ncbi:HNH endonuclease [Prevotella sp. P2-180]|nr:HNH endonuclease [Prevotella sp. P2-180]OYP65477.1 hypothetical protein CIK98_08445 [Prevotella sp. P2-180]
MAPYNDLTSHWREGGRTIESNCQMLCRECNRRKENNISFK